MWLALDTLKNTLVSLKILTADNAEDLHELRMLRYIEEHSSMDPRREYIMKALDAFQHEGPNGTHHCFTSQLGGPSLTSITFAPGEMEGTRRLSAPLARGCCRSLAKAVALLHELNIVHGGKS